jgi:hypothetical protein
MKLLDLHSSEQDGRARVAATVCWEDCDRPAGEIYFETEKAFAESLNGNPHSFLVGCIIPALYYGEKRVAIDHEICPELRDGLMTAQKWIRHWYYGEEREIVRIEAPIKSSVSPRNRERVGILLSGGIDSLSVLRHNRLHYPLTHPGSIKDAVVIQGLQGENHQTCQDIMHRLSAIAQDAEVVLIPLRTNIISVGGTVPWETHWMGSVLAAVAHALSNRLTCVSIAASSNMNDLMNNMQPYGSHPLLDPNYGSSNLRIRYEGVDLSRLEKTKLVAEWDVALQNIRVCNKVPKTGKTQTGTLNCGQCEKCLRTMLTLLALDVLHKTEVFPETEVSADWIRKHLSIEQEWIIPSYYEDLIDLLARRGRDDLVLAINETVAECRRRERAALWRTRLRSLDQKYLGCTLTRVRRTIRGVPMLRSPAM